jgi:CheY-like chemotaxis protein
MIRVLLVDDDPDVLEGFEIQLRNLRERWATTLVLGGKRAIELLEQERFDVIVSDYGMPGVDGEAVLTAALLYQPSAVRILLSGGLTPDSEVAHETLMKPCSRKVLSETVERLVSP